MIIVSSQLERAIEPGGDNYVLCITEKKPEREV